MRARSSPGMVFNKRGLDLARQRGRDAVGIDRVVVQPLGLEENLVPVAFGEPHHLVLDRRAIARADAFDLARIDRRAVEIGADQIVRGRRRAGDGAVRSAAW